MRPELLKHNIMSHTEIFSIKYYKNLVQNALHKNQEQHNRGHKLAMVTNLQELVPFAPYHAHAPSKNMLRVIYFLSATKHLFPGD